VVYVAFLLIAIIFVEILGMITALSILLKNIYFRSLLPSGQADLLCCGAFAVYKYGFMRHAVHIGL
jgi:hypothetical protein